MIGTATIERVFGLLLAAAIAGDRCPQAGDFGTLNPQEAQAVRVLAREGRIKIEIYGHNWRVVTIMAGEHKGKKTKAPPGQTTAGVPWRTIYKDDGVMPVRRSA